MPYTKCVDAFPMAFTDLSTILLKHMNQGFAKFFIACFFLSLKNFHFIVGVVANWRRRLSLSLLYPVQYGDSPSNPKQPRQSLCYLITTNKSYKINFIGLGPRLTRSFVISSLSRPTVAVLGMGTNQAAFQGSCQSDQKHNITGLKQTSVTLVWFFLQWKFGDLDARSKG
jgi:hypothetical protein